MGEKLLEGGWRGLVWSIGFSFGSVYCQYRGAVLSVYCQYIGAFSYSFWRMRGVCGDDESLGVRGRGIGFSVYLCAV